MREFNYHVWFKTRSKDEVSRLHLEQSNRLEKRKSKILVSSCLCIGLVVICTILMEQSNGQLAGVFGVLTIAAYFAGYFYCKTLWDIERNRAEYFEALRGFEDGEQI